MIPLSGPEKLREVKTEDIPKEELADISRIRIDPALPVGERMASYLEQIQNPYHFLCGDCAVHVRFEENGKPLAEKLKSYLASLREE